MRFVQDILNHMGAAGTGSPLFPAGYVAGTIAIGAGQAGAPQQLLALVQAQLDPNCPGAGQEVTLQTDSSGALYVGEPNAVGPLSTTNYGYCLDAAQSGFVAGASRTYRTAFPGSHSPVGSLSVLMTGAGTFHVEVA
jgi:hypothetical protein